MAQSTAAQITIMTALLELALVDWWASENIVMTSSSLISWLISIFLQLHIPVGRKMWLKWIDYLKLDAFSIPAYL